MGSFKKKFDRFVDEKVLMMKNLDAKERHKFKVSYAFFLSVAFFFMCFGLFEFYLYYKNEFELKYLILAIANWANGSMLFVLALITPCIIRCFFSLLQGALFEIYFFVNFLSISATLLTIQFLLRGLNTIATDMFCIILFASISTKSFYMPFYMVVIGVIYVGVYTFESIFSVKVESLMVSSLFKVVGCLLLWGFFVYQFQILKNDNKKEAMEIEAVAKSIASLSLDSKVVKEIKSTRDIDCFPALLQMKRIVKNVEIYFSYLPQSLKPKDNNEHNFDSFAVFDEESESSSSSSATNNSKKDKKDKSISFYNELERTDLAKSSLTLEFISLVVLDFELLSRIEEKICSSEKMANDYTYVFDRILQIIQPIISGIGATILCTERSKVYFFLSTSTVETEKQNKSIETATKALYKIFDEIKMERFEEAMENEMYAYKGVVKSIIIGGCGYIGHHGTKQFKRFEIIGEMMDYIQPMFKKTTNEKVNEVIVNRRVQIPLEESGFLTKRIKSTKGKKNEDFFGLVKKL